MNTRRAPNRYHDIMFEIAFCHWRQTNEKAPSMWMRCYNANDSKKIGV